MLDNGKYKGGTIVIQAYALKCKQKPSDAMCWCTVLSVIMEEEIHFDRGGKICGRICASEEI